MNDIYWVGFAGIVALLLFLDLGVFHKKSEETSIKHALLWSVVWVSVGLLFGAGIWFVLGPEKGMEYFTGFVIEKSLSVDNLFVFISIFAFFHVAPKYQHKILFYGIICAVLLRGAAIWGGAALLKEFHWLIYVFGAFLIFTGIKMLLIAQHEKDPGKNPVLQFVIRRFRTVANYDTDKFFIRQNGKLFVTPLFLALVAIEISDVIFALDSVPAIFAITEDPFIVYTSNVFAILGLRALFFVSAELVKSLRYINHGVAVVLVFVGVKMAGSGHFYVPTGVSLLVIATILGVAVTASVLKGRTSS